MGAQLEYVYIYIPTYRWHTCFCKFGADLHAQSVLIDKMSAPELSREFTKSAFVVGWVPFVLAF